MIAGAPIAMASGQLRFHSIRIAIAASTGAAMPNAMLNGTIPVATAPMSELSSPALDPGRTIA